MQTPGIANIRIEGDYAEGQRYVRAAQQLLAKLQAMLRAGGVESGGLHADLDEHVHAYARVGMDINVVNIVVDKRYDLAETPSIATKAVYPDFLSGIVYRGLIEPRTRTKPGGIPIKVDTLLTFRPTPDTAVKFGLQPNRQEIDRLAVLPSESIPDLESPLPAFIFSQYTRLKPTMYSGAMRELVQFLMGYGKLPPKSIYGEIKRVEVGGARRVFVPPPNPYEEEVRKNGVRIEYDYRWARTHGLLQGPDNRWWVVEIRQGRGIHAMPLRFWKGTDEPDFRKLLTEKHDADGLAVLDRFGGFPTGEPFPSSSAELDAWVRAGIALKLPDAESLNRFYEDMSFYSSGMGWAFSGSGRKAHNTAWYFGEDGVQRGVHYAAELVVGPVLDLPTTTRADEVKAFVMPALRQHPELIRPTLAKADRLSAAEAASILRERDSSAAFDRLNAMVLQPMADLTGGCSMAGEAPLFWLTPIGPQIKFFEPMLGYCVSHDFRPMQQGRRLSPKCDTVMHVHFSGETLHYVKYYRMPTKLDPTVVDETDECMYVGTWKTETRSGEQGVPAMFYSDEIDARRDVSEHVTTTTRVGVDIGYIRVYYVDDVTNPPYSMMFRTKGFKHTITTETVVSARYGTSIMIPHYMREAYFHAKKESFDRFDKSVMYGYVELQDPYSYSGWRNFPGYTGFLPSGCGATPVPSPDFPGCWRLADHPAGCGKVTDRRVLQEFYNPTGCSDFADGGGWAGTCDQIELLAYNRELPALPPATSTTSPPTAQLIVNLMANHGGTPIQTFTKTATGDAAVGLGYRWFRPSPDPDTGETDVIDAYGNALGTGDYLQFSMSINEPYAWVGSPKFDDMPTDITFIGVVNG